MIQAKDILDILYAAIMLFSVIMAIRYWKHLGSRQLQIMLPYLIFIFIQEVILVLANMDRLGYYTNNALVYNISRPVSALVFAYIYYRIPFMAPFRKLIIGITIIYLAITLINYCFIESIYTASSYLALTRGFLITFYGILFLFRYFHLDNTTEEKYWRPLIWITTGIVIFYPVISISISFQKYINVDGATLYDIKIYQLIPKVMSIFMYSCFGYAFYLCQKKN